jgi:hypothetical protein
VGETVADRSTRSFSVQLTVPRLGAATTVTIRNDDQPASSGSDGRLGPAGIFQPERAVLALPRSTKTNHGRGEK